MDQAIESFCDIVRNNAWVNDLETWIPIIRDLFAIIAACYAIKGFDTWRIENEFKYKNDIATRLMVATYELEEAFIKARQNDETAQDFIFFWGNETYNSEDQNKTDLAHQILVERHKHLGMKFDEFMKLSIIAQISFSNSIKVTIQQFRKQYEILNESFIKVSFIFNGNYISYKKNVIEIFNGKTLEILFSKEDDDFNKMIENLVNDIESILGKSLIKEKKGLTKIFRIR